MALKTIILEIDVEEGEEATVKELLAYLAYTKRVKKYLWRDKEAGLPKHIQHAAAAVKKAEAPPVPPKQAESSPMIHALLQQLVEWRKQDKLIRLKALKGKGKFLDIACKIVNHDADAGTVTVYDVDRKVVETVRLSEIEDINLAL